MPPPFRTRLTYELSPVESPAAHVLPVNALAIGLDFSGGGACREAKDRRDLTGIRESRDSKDREEDAGTSTGVEEASATLFSAGRDALVLAWDLHLTSSDSFIREKDRKRERNSTLAALAAGPAGRRRRVSLSGGHPSSLPQFHNSSQNTTQTAHNAQNNAPNSPKNMRKTQSFTTTSPMYSLSALVSSRISVPSRSKLTRSWSHVDANVTTKGRKSLTFQAPPPTTFSHSYAHHTDWVTSLVLVNQNRNLVTASHDQTLLLWPNRGLFSGTTSETDMEPRRLGHHLDYVKALAYSSHINQVFSGGLDRRIIAWDVGEGRDLAARIVHHDSQPSGSVYCLASNSFGTTVVSGSPDKIVKIHDPRTSDGNVARLTGHSDLVRAVLVSEDGRIVVSGGADSMVKVWDVRMGRCSVTYTHHADSVWALYSSSPTLDIVYSGGRDGWISKIYRQVTDGIDEHASVIPIAHESHGISSIVAIEDSFVWTANVGDSKIRRYRDVVLDERVGVDVDGGDLNGEILEENGVLYAPGHSVIQQPPPIVLDDSVSIKSSIRHSLASFDRKPGTFQEFIGGTSPAVTAITTTPRDPSKSEESMEEGSFGLEGRDPVFKLPNSVIDGASGIIKSFMLNNRRHVLTLDNDGVVVMWDIILCAPVKMFGRTDFEKTIEKENTFEYVANWCSVEIKTGNLQVHVEENKWFDAEAYHDELDLQVPCRGEDQRIVLGRWVMTYLLFNYLKVVWGEPLNEPGIMPNISESDVGPSAGLSTKGLAPRSLHDAPVSPWSPVVSPLPREFSKMSEESIEAMHVGDGNKENRGLSLNPGKDHELASSRFVVRASPIGTPPPAEYADKLNFDEVPFITLPPQTPVILGIQETPESCGYLDILRTSVGTLNDVHEVFDKWVPSWVRDGVLEGKLPTRDAVKLSFVLSPCAGTTLPNLPVNANRLSANRMLRVRKVLTYLSEKLDVGKMKKGDAEGTLGMGLELVCGNKVLDPRWTLATVKHHVYKQGGDLPMSYRAIASK